MRCSLLAEGAGLSAAGLQWTGMTARDYGDASSAAVWGDALFLTAGYLLIYVYVQAVLGRWDRVEQRAGLGQYNLLLLSLCMTAYCPQPR